jgi:hypothetical protein
MIGNQEWGSDLRLTKLQYTIMDFIILSTWATVVLLQFSIDIMCVFLLFYTISDRFWNGNNAIFVTIIKIRVFQICESHRWWFLLVQFSNFIRLVLFNSFIICKLVRNWYFTKIEYQLLRAFSSNSFNEIGRWSR